MLVREPLAGTRKTALDLVEHQQPAALGADAPQAAQIIVMGDVNAALALDRLHQHGNDVGIVLRDRLDGRQIVERNTDEAGYQRLEACLHLAIAGG